MGKKIVIALGGNAILQPKQKATYENQLSNVQKSTEIIAEIIKNGHRMIITHGNGPQVGNILRQNEIAKDVIPPLPLDVCNAESQGFMSYMIDHSLKNSLRHKGLNHQVVSLLTQTKVSKDDPSFQNPTKPIGQFYTEERAKELAKEKGWTVKEDSNRGWRRVVPSPAPKTILGSEAVKLLANQGSIVITSGGGGIPVIRNEAGDYEGIEAVVEKDSSACKLALETKADIFMILTDVSNVCINYGTPEERALRDLTIAEAESYIEEGHFLPGSMEPKMAAALKFAKNGGHSVICSLHEVGLALAGEAGTTIRPDESAV